MSARLIALLLLALVATGCATAEESLDWNEDGEAQVGDLSDEVFTEKIINGRLTFDFPAAGKLLMSGSLCTATLVRPTVVLTAAHCVDYATVERPGQRLGQFVIEHDQNRQFAFDVDAIVSYSRTGPGTDDIALVRLARAVPANVATPVPFADRRPNQGEDVTWYGYGCQNRNGNDGFAGRKQKIAFAFQQSDNSCPGDSGGPTVFGADGAVFRVTSGYSIPGGDIFGDVVAFRGTLEAQANAWGGALDSGNVDNGGNNGGNDNGNNGEVDNGNNDAPDVAPPAGNRPTIRRTLIQNGWMFVEWNAVAGERSYLQFLVVEAPNGGVATYLYRESAGQQAGQGGLYGYFNARSVCQAVRNQGYPAGVYRLWTQVWPGRDDSRAESARFDQAIRCSF